jgi:ubiquinone/menaquinone biosynthesis C-methylase UbiE
MLRQYISVPMLWLRNRSIRPELLDHAREEDARSNLADIVRLNRQFGGHQVILRMLAKVAVRDEAFSMLDVGAASGDTARLVRQNYPRAQVVSLDLHVQNLAAAPAPKAVGDAFRLPFQEGAFEFVFCSLFLHHFPNDQVVTLLREMHRVARKALLICDLERHPLAWIFIPATWPLFRWHWITLHDGPVSVRAAFTQGELRRLAERAGIRNAESRSHRPAFRLSLVAEKGH